MIRILLLSTSMFLAIGLLAQDVKLASDVWPPFTNEFGEPAFAMMLVHEALSRSNRSATTSIESFEDVITGIKNGKFDGSAALWRTDERADFLLYSRPYLENRLVLVGPAGSDVSARKIGDLAGKKVAIVAGYAYGDDVDAGTGVNFVETAGDQQSLDLVLSGDADYMLADDLLMRYLLEHQPQDVSENLAVGSQALFKRTLHFAVRKELPNAEEMVLDFDEQIRNMVLDGTYNKILQINWIETDVDGDGITELVLGGTSAGVDAPSGGYSIMTQGQEVSPLAESERYYIDGQIYDGWRNVPSKYKKKPGQQTADGGFGPKLRF